MEDWQHSSLEEKVDLENLVLFPPDLYPISGINELRSGIKEGQSENDNDLVDNPAQKDIKTEKDEVIERDSATQSFEFCRDGAESCQICGLEFGNKDVLKIHNSLVHPEGNKDDQNIDLGRKDQVVHEYEAAKIDNLKIHIKLDNEGFKLFKTEMCVKPRIETEFQAKSESIEEFNRGMDIIGIMNAPGNCEIKNEKIEIPYKRPKIEMDVKPKIETEFQAKSESIEEFNRGMEIIGNMNVPANCEIKNENIDPKFQAQSESIDDINRGMMIIVIMNKIIEFMNIPIKAEIQNENINVPYKIPKIKMDSKPKIEKDFKTKSESKSEEIGKYYCIICSKKNIPTKKLLKRHLNFAHEKDIAKKTRCDKCMVPFFGKPNLKISHMVDCYLCTKTKIYCKSNQKKPVVKAKINSEKPYCFMCSQTKFYTNESLIQHLYSVHMGIIKEKKKCDLCMISFRGGINTSRKHQRSPNIHERISHFFNCYQKKRNKIKN